jgi:hypothetical protein
MQHPTFVSILSCFQSYTIFEHTLLWVMCSVDRIILGQLDDNLPPIWSMSCSSIVLTHTHTHTHICVFYYVKVVIIAISGKLF